MRKNIKLIPLFLFLFVFQLLYFLSTIYTEKIDHIFLILAVFMILICILLYCVLSDVLKKSNTEMELAFLQKQKQLKQEQDYSLPENISIDTTDLSSIFFNLLDNAIEACNASGNPDPEIRLSANISNGFLTVYMHNTKAPMQTFTHKTTKSEPGAHGYGLSIIEDICQRYNGSYQWIDHNDTFDSIVLLQIKNL